MGLDERQGQLGQFAGELFEAAVFLGPLFGLGNQIHRDVSGVGFGLHFPGQIVAQMLFASGTAAIGVAAGTTDRNEAGGQDRAFGLELLLAGLKGAADQGGMFRNFHMFKHMRTRAISQARMYDEYKGLSYASSKSTVATTFITDSPASSAGTARAAKPNAKEARVGQ